MIAAFLWACLVVGWLICAVVALDALAAAVLWRGEDDEPGRWSA